MNLFEGNDMGTNTIFPLLTILPALLGSGLLLAGLTIHPLIQITSKSDGDIKQISIWQVTTKNRDSLPNSELS